jgi:hypothetical protein
MGKFKEFLQQQIEEAVDEVVEETVENTFEVNISIDEQPLHYKTKSDSVTSVLKEISSKYKLSVPPKSIISDKINYLKVDLNNDDGQYFIYIKKVGFDDSHLFLDDE